MASPQQSARPILGVAVTLVRTTLAHGGNNAATSQQHMLINAHTVSNKQLQVLMITRKFAPNAGMCAPPGGRVQHGERLVDAAIRELREETGVRISPSQLNNLAFMTNQHPKVQFPSPPTPFFTNEAILDSGHFVILHYCAMWNASMDQPQAASDAHDVFWADPWELAEKNATGTNKGVPDLGNLMKTLLKYIGGSI